MNNFDKFKAGIYRHYKGQHYMVYGLGHDSNYDNRDVVLYLGLELDKDHTGPRWAVRTYDDFYAWVNPQTGEPLEQGAPEAVERFIYIGSTWTGQ